MSTLNVLNITDGTNTKTTSAVLNASNNGSGEIGTYAFLRRGDLIVFGTSYSGAELSPAGSGHQSGNLTLIAGSSAGTIAGTWRAMGGATDGARPLSTTLFVRIA